jgi:hypothetical protein
MEKININSYKMPPKKSKDYKSKKDEPCYTRTSKSGKKYITCEGSQRRNVKLQREISKLHGRTRKKVTKAEFTEARKSLKRAVPMELQGGWR